MHGTLAARYEQPDAAIDFVLAQSRTPLSKRVTSLQRPAKSAEIRRYPNSSIRPFYTGYRALMPEKINAGDLALNFVLFVPW